VFWKSQLIKKINALINEFKICNVIVTIPPFKLAHHCISIKNKYPNINLIVDYRDPWTDNKSFHGFKGLSKTRLSYEISVENEVLRAADKVISVSQEMSQKLINRDITSASKFFAISNGFDEEDIIFSNRIKKYNEEYFTFIYAGSLYSNLDYVIEPLLENLLYLKQNNTKLFNKLKFEFYGNQDVQLTNKIKKANLDIIKVFGQVSLNTVYEKIDDADFCLLFSAPDHSFAFNTKFFEYLACRKPILLFSNAGKTSEFIFQNNLGYTIDPSDFKNSFEEFLIKITNNSFNHNSEFDIGQFSVKKMTKDLDHLLC
jgi:glycosyltransferase involved in cell wall biosynthesis